MVEVRDRTTREQGSKPASAVAGQTHPETFRERDQAVGIKLDGDAAAEPSGRQHGRQRFALFAGAPSEGVGEAIARALLQQGYRVLVCDPKEEAVEIYQRLNHLGEIDYLNADAYTPQGLQTLSWEISGHVDLLVVNADGAGSAGDNMAPCPVRLRRRLEKLVAVARLAEEIVDANMRPYMSGVAIFVDSRQHDADAMSLEERAAAAALREMVSCMQERGRHVRFHVLRPGIQTETDRTAREQLWNGLDPNGLLGAFAMAQMIALLGSDEARRLRGLDLVVNDDTWAVGLKDAGQTSAEIEGVNMVSSPGRSTKKAA